MERTSIVWSHHAAIELGYACESGAFHCRTDHLFQRRKIYVINLLDANAALTHVHLSQLLLMLLGDVLTLFYGAHVEADVLLLASECDHRPLNPFLFVVRVGETSIAEHVGSEVGLQCGRGLLDECMKNLHRFTAFGREHGEILLHGGRLGGFEHVHRFFFRTIFLGIIANCHAAQSQSSRAPGVISFDRRR